MGPIFDSVLPQDVQQVLDLGPLLNEVLEEIEKSSRPYIDYTAKFIDATTADKNI